MVQEQPPWTFDPIMCMIMCKCRYRADVWVQAQVQVQVQMQMYTEHLSTRWRDETGWQFHTGMVQFHACMVQFHTSMMQVHTGMVQFHTGMVYGAFSAACTKLVARQGIGPGAWMLVDVMCLCFVVLRLRFDDCG
jgi:hypothetical protein